MRALARALGAISGALRRPVGLGPPAPPPRVRRLCGLALAWLLLLPSLSGHAVPQGPHFRELAHFVSPAARQGVAVDGEHVYVVSNRRIEKVAKGGGPVLAAWQGAEGGPIVHLNSGIVLDGRLYCAHSNYPGVPMTSSIEVFDAVTLEHVDSHRLGSGLGSATWVDRHDGHWWVGFGQYQGRGGETGKGPERTSVVEFDAGWRRLESFTFPPEVVQRFGTRSNSGGAFGPDGRLYATGHQAPEVYVLELPRDGSVLRLVHILPAPIEGQGIAWDPARPGVLYGLRKSERVVVESELVEGE